MAEKKDSTSKDKPSSEAADSKQVGKGDQPSKAEPSDRARDDDEDDELIML